MLDIRPVKFGGFLIAWKGCDNKTDYRQTKTKLV